MDSKWLIIGISGVTCGGKTTLAKQVVELLPGVKSISQDDYFYPEDSSKHILLPELNHFNWELLSSLDMEKMYEDIQEIVHNQLIHTDVTDILEEFDKIKNAAKNDEMISKNVIYSIQNKLVTHNIQILLLEGFSIFNYQPIDEICHLKFYLTLCRETCYARRSNRTYIPADVPGYFDKCIWPEYVRQSEEIKEKSKNVVYLTEEMKSKISIVVNCLHFFLKKVYN